jgi:hypothetical protein
MAAPFPEGFEGDPAVIAWTPTPATLRDAILAGEVMAPDYIAGLPPALVNDMMRLTQPGEVEVRRIGEMARRAVMAGRVIDFGFLPNQVMSWGGKRGGPLWQKGAIGQPFEDPWLMLHTWEKGTGVYLVNPAVGGMEIAELQPLRIDADKVLTVGDRGKFFNDDSANPNYHAVIVPCPIRYIGIPELREHVNKNMRDDDTPEQAASGNIGDPVSTGLLILATRAVPRERVEADPKLQRARAKRGKEPLPPYEVVDTREYVTAILARGKQRGGEDQGGTHRSPVPHVRMGHPRDYASGRSIWIADTLVGVPEERRQVWKAGRVKAGRSHYTVRP